MKKLVLFLCSILFYSYSFGGASGSQFSRYKTSAWQPGDPLTAADLEGEFTQIYNNLDLNGVGGYSTSLVLFKAVSQPDESSLPSSALTELKTLRYCFDKTYTLLNGTDAEWYNYNSTYQVRCPVGDLIYPSYSFVGRTNTGLYSPANYQLALISSGTAIFSIYSSSAVASGLVNASSFTATNGLQVGNGSVGTPSLSFANDTNTGFYTGGIADTIYISTGGSQWGYFAGTQLLTPMTDGTASPNICGKSDANTGIRWDGSETISIINNGAQTATFDATYGLYNVTGVTLKTASTNNLLDIESNGSGAGTLYIGNTALAVASDKRIKKNITDTKIIALDKLNKLRVVDFNWNDPMDKCPNNRNTRGKWTGLIAQETIDILPFVINAEDRKCKICKEGKQCKKHTTNWQIEYANIVPVLIKAIQEQQIQIEELKNRIELLESK